MLAAYCEALGVRPFEEQWYGQEGVLVSKRDLPVWETLSLREAQARWGIRPGLASTLED